MNVDHFRKKTHRDPPRNWSVDVQEPKEMYKKPECRCTKERSVRKPVVDKIILAFTTTGTTRSCNITHCVCVVEYRVKVIDHSHPSSQRDDWQLRVCCLLAIHGSSNVLVTLICLPFPKIFWRWLMLDTAAGYFHSRSNEEVISPVHSVKPLWESTRCSYRYRGQSVGLALRLEQWKLMLWYPSRKPIPS